LEFKTNLVKETLFKVGGLEIDVLPCVSSMEYGYRNKGVFPLGRNIGMFELNSHNIVPIDKCLLMNDKINLTLSLVKEWISENNVKTFDFANYKGLLKYLVVRSVGEQTLICLVANSSDIKHLDKLVDKLSVLGRFGLYININNQHNSIILGRDYKHITGINAIELEEFGIKYDIDVASFLQVNNEIKTKLYSEVNSCIGGGIVIDAYAGAGLLSATLSKSASKVYSVEIVSQASEKARQLVKANDITNIEVINGDCTKIVPNLIKKVQNEIKSNNSNLKCSVVLDPAHVGCSPEVIESVKTADQIIYIACNPIALAKDLKVLQNTHKIVKIEPYDMFPQTKHIETLAILQRSCDN
ncbi:MAG: 23S rRNA (uracil(1939)-C(5))-methyltransferase RlmD, partial [Clostridia bacterium]|nr:23S rRNA (uracil(1939)-C(5))-methyltransferase RlmD [Clostridia bacterium]